MNDWTFFTCKGTFPQCLSSWILIINWAHMQSLCRCFGMATANINEPNNGKSLDEYFTATVFWATKLLCGGLFHITLDNCSFFCTKIIWQGSAATYLRCDEIFVIAQAQQLQYIVHGQTDTFSIFSLPVPLCWLAGRRYFTPPSAVAYRTDGLHCIATI